MNKWVRSLYLYEWCLEQGKDDGYNKDWFDYWVRKVNEQLSD